MHTKYNTPTLLSRTFSVDMKTAAATTLFTSDKHRKTVITSIVIHGQTASLAGGTVYKFGVYFRADGTVDLSGSTATTNVIVLHQGDDNALATIVPQSTAVVMTVTTGSTLACTATIDVFGYLI